MKKKNCARVYMEEAPLTACDGWLLQDGGLYQNDE